MACSCAVNGGTIEYSTLATDHGQMDWRRDGGGEICRGMVARVLVYSGVYSYLELFHWILVFRIEHLQMHTRSITK